MMEKEYEERLFTFAPYMTPLAQKKVGEYFGPLITQLNLKFSLVSAGRSGSGLVFIYTALRGARAIYVGSSGLNGKE